MRELFCGTGAMIWEEAEAFPNDQIERAGNDTFAVEIWLKLTKSLWIDTIALKKAGKNGMITVYIFPYTNLGYI